jgi:hypothetical protein
MKTLILCAFVALATLALTSDAVSVEEVLASEWKAYKAKHGKYVAKISWFCLNI